MKDLDRMGRRREDGTEGRTAPVNVAFRPTERRALKLANERQNPPPFKKKNLATFLYELVARYFFTGFACKHCDERIDGLFEEELAVETEERERRERRT